MIKEKDKAIYLFENILEHQQYWAEAIRIYCAKKSTAFLIEEQIAQAIKLDNYDDWGTVAKYWVNVKKEFQKLDFKIYEKDK